MNITSKTRIDSFNGYDIIHHKKAMYLRVNGEIVTNRRGRPKKFVEYQHIRQWLEEHKEAIYAHHEVMQIYREASQAMQDAEKTLDGGAL